MKLAVCQMEMIWENKAANYKKAEQLCKRAEAMGADLICFPEMSFTGFSMKAEKKLAQEKNF